MRLAGISVKDRATITQLNGVNTTMPALDVFSGLSVRSAPSMFDFDLFSVESTINKKNIIPTR